MQVFDYSKKNEAEFVLPKEYEELLEKETRKKKKKRIGLVLFFVKLFAIVTLCVSLGIIAKKLYGYWTDEKYAEAQQSSVSTSTETHENVIKRETPVYPEYKGSEERVVSYPQVVETEKLKQLAKVYPDFVCWFYIENTSISYPVVYNETTNFYLRRNMDGEENLSGTLFFDERNDVKTLEGNCIIYGHAMQNGTMFGTLKNYASKSYFDEHKTIYLYTTKEVLVYKIFSAYETTTKDNYIKTAFQEKGLYQEFLEARIAKSIYNTGVTVPENADIITLSTCHYYTSNKGRFVVHAYKAGSIPLV